MADLSTISEEIEREALVSLHEHCPAQTKQALGLHLLEVADALIVAAENNPGVLLNRTAGLGTRTQLELESLQAVIDCYQKLAINNYFLHLYQQDLSQEAKQLLAKTVL